CGLQTFGSTGAENRVKNPAAYKHSAPRSRERDAKARAAYKHSAPLEPRTGWKNPAAYKHSAPLEPRTGWKNPAAYKHSAPLEPGSAMQGSRGLQTFGSPGAESAKTPSRNPRRLAAYITERDDSGGAARRSILGLAATVSQRLTGQQAAEPQRGRRSIPSHVLKGLNYGNQETRP
ncbi:MAG TPA: hypothetical protein VKJ45_18930, partial [Blastocatellia bacterium]|nr:hypothetical protein [Blastocatellia bacterium]